MARQPELCWGITIFDVLVMNPDRHNKNLSFNRQTSEVQIFDHSHAFLQSNGNPDLIVAQMSGKLAVGGHCLKAELSNWNGFDVWTSRIKGIPDYAIDTMVEETCHVGLPTDKKKSVSDFMKQRRDQIDVVITSHLQEFPKLGPRI